MYLPDCPFVHGDLIRFERLRHFNDIYDPEFSRHFKTPCVVFTGHPSLRFGDAIHFLHLWGRDARNTVIFTEPDFPYLGLNGIFLVPDPVFSLFCVSDAFLLIHLNFLNCVNFGLLSDEEKFEFNTSLMFPYI